MKPFAWWLLVAGAAPLRGRGVLPEGPEVTAPPRAKIVLEGLAAELLVLLRRPRGKRGGRPKLSAEAVRDLRRRAAAGESLEALAAERHVTRETVKQFVRGRTWQGVG
jgi:hypothetical protein